jgi:hypothetical protein
MTKKRILLVGDGNHQFITNYAFWLRRELGDYVVIDILSFSPIKKVSFQFYESCYQIAFDSFGYKFFSKFKGIRRYFRFLLYTKLISTLQPYHFVHFHFIDVDSYFLTKLLKSKFNNKIILSIWGSDLYKLHKKNERGFLKTINTGDLITFTNQESCDYFKQKFDWRKDNLKICRFGLAPLENLKNLDLSKNDCKRNLGLDEEKIIITIGYNLSQAQQHLIILEQFKKDVLVSLKNRIVLFFPITYGGTVQYKEELLGRIKELPFQFYVFDTFLTDEQVAVIRKASDIMIQLQETDQFSGSMQEHLFANNIVITGCWLPYQTLKDKGAWFFEVAEIEEIVFLISEIIENPIVLEDKTLMNPLIISELSSWNENIKSWASLYKNL